MRWNDETYKHLPEKEQWLVNFLGHYAALKLNKKYDTKSKLQSPVINAGYLCCDGRRIPTIRKHLNNLIEPSYPTNDILTPKDEEVEKLLAGYSVEPKFNTTGYRKTKENSWSEEVLIPIQDRGRAYRNIDKLSAGEVIHVYLNQHLYDIQLFTVTTVRKGSYGNGSSDNHRYFVKVFPIALIDTLDDAILHAHNETFAKSHAKEVLSASLGCRFRAIKDDKGFLSLAESTQRIWDVEDKMRILRRTLKELKVLQRNIAKVGDEQFKSNVIATSYEYLRMYAPLWVNNDKDSDRKELAMLMLKGSSLITELRSK
jgi:hypothetical protein